MEQTQWRGDAEHGSEGKAWHNLCSTRIKGQRLTIDWALVRQTVNVVERHDRDKRRQQKRTTSPTLAPPQRFAGGFHRQRRDKGNQGGERFSGLPGSRSEEH